MSVELLQVNFSHHPIGMFADEMRNLISPLNEIAKIEHFSYEKITPVKDQKEIVFLTTHPSSTKDIFIPNKFYEVAYFGEVENYKDGFYLWSFFEDDLVLKATIENLGMKNGVTIVKPRRDFCEFYFFASTDDSPLINYFFLDNKELFESFIFYFKDKAKEMLEIAENNKILMPETSSDNTLISAQNYLKEITSKVKSKKRELLNNELLYGYKVDALIQKHFGTQLKKEKLTQREFQCVLYLTKGYNAKQIARKLDVSTRTIEKHIEHLKEKTNTHSVLELVVKLLGVKPDWFS